MYRTAPDYLAQVDLSGEKPLSVWDKVFKQAIQHTRRLKAIELLDVNRPNESDVIKSYRNSIARRLTREGVFKFIAKKSRIYKNSGLDIDKGSISDALNEWLNTKPFVVNGRRLGFQDYIYEFLSIVEIEDPNALHVPFPINPRNRHINPSAPVEEGGLSSTEQVDIEMLIINSWQRRHLDEHIIAWQHGDWMFGRDDEFKAPYYFIGDRDNWYMHFPTGWDKGRITYDTILWYAHNTGSVPGQTLPGILSKSEEGKDYNESFLSTYFEFADEFVTAFSDSQAVRVQHSYPKTVMEDLPCPANCRNGKVFSVDNDGKEQSHMCKVCKGTGIINDIGPYSVLRKPVGGLNTKTSERPVEYLEMPESSLRFGHEVSFEFLDRGKRAVGLDLLENVSESGLAKEYRLEDLSDFLSLVSESEVRFMETLLWFCECLLVVDPADRIMPVIKRPDSLEVKTAHMLMEEAKQALPSDRVQRHKDYFKSVYRGKPRLIRIHSLAVDYAPLLVLNDNELTTRLATAYTPEDLIKADRAVWAITKIAAEYDSFMTMEDTRVFELADQIIQPFIDKERLELYG